MPTPNPLHGDVVPRRRRIVHAAALLLLSAALLPLVPAWAAADLALTRADVVMAEAVIAENTLTLRLPGLGTSVDGPGPLTDADRLILLALKFDIARKGLVPFGEIRRRLEQGEPRPMMRRVGEEFWAWYRQAAEKGEAHRLGSLKDRFGTYIAMKNTARRKAANRVLGAQVQSEAAWRKAMESDTKFRQGVAARADQAAANRAAYLQAWHLQGEADAAAAQAAWDSAMAYFPYRSQ
jgi:hypothetical protein